MEKIRVQNLTFKYPLAKKNAIEDINLTIEKSQFAVVCGKSGCGKSTLLRHLKKQMIPYGEKTGQVFIENTEIEEIDERKSVSQIGFIQQNPEAQIVTDKVWHELAFGLENLGMANQVIKRRVAEMANYFGIQTWFQKDVTQLSGGQKQLLNLASVMVMQPEILILDEPTSQLDPIATSEFLNTLQKINKELGTTIVISEHRLEEVIPMADKIIVMDEGKIIANESPKKVVKLLDGPSVEKRHPMFYGFPTVMKIFQGEKWQGNSPLTVRDGRLLLEEKLAARNVIPVKREEKPFEFDDKQGIIELKDVWFKYGKGQDFILKGVDLKVPKGSFYCMLGGNGAGKSTLLKTVSGYIKPLRGKVKYMEDTKISMVPQNPEALFTEITVEEEMYEGISHMAFDDDYKIKKVEEMLETMEIGHLRKANPYDLSGGEKQRLAIGKVLLTEPDVILLDEPTKGLDPFFKITLARIFFDLLDKGKTIFMVSHDIEFCAQYGEICAMFFDGEIVSYDQSKSFFAGNNFYTTSANKLFRNYNENIVTCEEAEQWLRKVL